MEFCSGVAVVLKGDVTEKAKMLFRLYDKNGDNKITRLEMADVRPQTTVPSPMARS